MTRIKSYALPLICYSIRYYGWFMSDSWKIAAFYHFTDLPDYHTWAERMVEHGLKVGLRGTLIFAPEGVNSTCAGSPEAIDSTIALLQFDARFEGMSVRYS